MSGERVPGSDEERGSGTHERRDPGAGSVGAGGAGAGAGAAGGAAEGAGAESGDETRVVVRPDARTSEPAQVAEREAESLADDATRVVIRPADDATRVVARPDRSAGASGSVDPERIAAPESAAAPAADPEPAVVTGAGSDPEPDADAVSGAALPVGDASAADDATRVVSRPAPESDATVVVGGQVQSAGRPGADRGSSGSTVDSRTGTGDSAAAGGRADAGSQTGGGAPAGVPAPPVAEPVDRRGLPQEMFKPPLDPRRRARKSPFPQEEHTLPRRGVRPGLPVVSGPRPEFTARSRTELDPASPLARIGPAPQASGAPAAAERTALRSTARVNRRFALTAVVGGAAVVIIVLSGLAGIAWIAFS